MSPTAALQQRHAALQVANEVRLAGAQIRQQVQAGKVSCADALFDERAQSIPVYRLLSAKPRWGSQRTRKVLRSLAIFPDKRVRDLTDRQKTLLAEVVR